MAQRIGSFSEFWPFYVGEHAQPLNRKLHFIGTSLALVCTAAALVTLRWWLFALLPVSGYSFAWIGHFFVEKNRPATFQYPVWSLWGDLVMYGKMWSGEMDDEVRRLASAPNKDRKTAAAA